MKEPNNRRLSAARRAISRQKERYSLFDWAGIAVQEGYVDESPEKRLEEFAEHWADFERRQRISNFSGIRLALRSIKPEFRKQVKTLWRERGSNGVARYPSDYFLTALKRFVPPEWLLFNAEDVIRRESAARIGREMKARLWVA